MGMGTHARTDARFHSGKAASSRRGQAQQGCLVRLGGRLLGHLRLGLGILEVLVPETLELVGGVAVLSGDRLEVVRELVWRLASERHELLGQRVGALGGLLAEAGEDGHCELLALQRLLGHDLVDEGLALAALADVAEDALESDDDLVRLLDVHVAEDARDLADVLILDADGEIRQDLVVLVLAHSRCVCGLSGRLACACSLFSLATVWCLLLHQRGPHARPLAIQGRARRCSEP
mmetsp:Transcript_5082/g.13048  ORF Transcript_5082/g.13048 Transcript_5082/m.13048 type:complete len:235 (+) Transcript_5082:581-1285(+)|eukprot:CAMPEP_0202072384 /NCGR_PEP_ID=MMETSP0964-20121228/2391_1 /ASSEMBLY_ACC=CAM_ASM_000500 /TAXON_ID=4773 /ORGANISM="Schizochytrium aggregatum, Strain ATCC28209" /LENGTH=234 /DNA_ID=CAMNT_0048639413 /DNA_START=491 /DNA_END=1192 /DNA_ORIENTATION=+